MQNNLEVHGEFPAGHVFKAFLKLEHAKAFVVQGRFRMGLLRTYRKIEDGKRRDESEGHGHIRVLGQVVTAHFDANDAGFIDTTEGPGYRDVHTDLGNPIYIFSTSLPEIDLGYLQSRFGEFIVQIDDPKQFAHDITEHLKRRPEKFAGGIEGSFVSYNRGDIVDAQLDNLKRISLSYSQKSTVFINECEFRLVAIIMDRPSTRKASEYLEIDLGGPITYSRIIDVPASNKLFQADAEKLRS